MGAKKKDKKREVRVEKSSPPMGEELKKLIQLMNDNSLVELELEEKGRRVRLKKAAQASSEVIHHIPTVPMSHAPMAAAPAVSAAGPAPLAPGVAEIKSPIVGSFYRAPAPDADPYVEVGAKVKAEQTVCIVEAMKVMNEIKTEFAGEVLEILVENGQAVEFGQALFRLKKFE